MSAPERTEAERAEHARQTLRWLDAEAQDAVSRAGEAWQASHPDR